MNFRVGQKVVCIYHLPHESRRSGCNYPEKGSVYTVRGHVAGTDAKERILLDEVYNQPMRCIVGTIEWGFRADAFRPIVERKTDISVFHEILRKATKPERSPVVSLQP